MEEWKLSPILSLFSQTLSSSPRFKRYNFPPICPKTFAPLPMALVDIIWTNAMSSCHPLSSIFWTAHGSSFNKSLQTTDMVSKGGLEFTWQYVQIIFNVSIGDTWIYILRMDPCLWYFEQCFIVRWNMFPPFLLLLISALTAEAADTLKGDQHYQQSTPPSPPRPRSLQAWWSVWTTRIVWVPTENVPLTGGTKHIKTHLGWVSTRFSSQIWKPTGIWSFSPKLANGQVRLQTRFCAVGDQFCLPSWK